MDGEGICEARDYVITTDSGDEILSQVEANFLANRAPTQYSDRGLY